MTKNYSFDKSNVDDSNFALYTSRNSPFERGVGEDHVLERLSTGRGRGLTVAVDLESEDQHPVANRLASVIQSTASHFYQTIPVVEIL